MVVKGEIATREDMNGEFTPTPNTNLLINFKQIPNDYTQESYSIAEEREEFVAEGYPRSFLDDISINYNTIQNNLISSSGFTVTGIFQSQYHSDLFQNSTKCGNLSLAYLESTSNFYNDGGSARSISMFFKPVDDDLTGTATIFTQRISTNRGYHIGILDGRLYCRAYDSSGNYVWNTYVTTENLVSGTWYHIIMCHSSTNLKVFLNGVLRKNFTISGTPDYIRHYGFGAMLGGGYRFKGYIRSFYVLSYQLSTNEGIAFGTTYKNNFRAIPLSSSITYTGTWAYVWKNSTNFHNDYVVHSTTANDTFELTFFGNKIDLYMRQYANAGTCNIYIDDVFIETLDNYALTDTVELVGTYEQNTKAIHTLKVEVVTNYSDIDYVKIYDINYLVGVHGNDLHLDWSISYRALEYEYPYGIPRYLIDGFDERGIFFTRYLNEEDDDLYLTNGATFKLVTDLFDKPTKVVDLANGGYGYTNNTPSSTGLGTRAFVCWFKCDSSDLGNSTYASIATQRSTTNRGYHLGINQYDWIYFRVYDSVGTLIASYDTSTPPTTLKANKWYMFALAHDSSNWSVYLDGALITSGSLTGTPDYTTNYFKFGVQGSSNTLQFYGQIATCFLDSMLGGVWTPLSVPDFYDNAFTTYRYYPLMAKQTITGDWIWTQQNIIGNYKVLESTTLNDEISITFTAKTFGIYAIKYTDSGVFSYYLDDVYIGNISTYSASPSWTLVINYSFDEIETHTLKIVNSSGNLIRIANILFGEGNNIIQDESGKENHCEMEYLIGLTDTEFRNNILPSKYEFMLESNLSYYPYCPRLIIPEEVFETLGDKWFMAGIVKPMQDTIDSGFLIFNNTVGSDNTFFRLGLYQNPASATNDQIRLYGNFINEYVDLGSVLSYSKYYFIGVIVDDDTDTLRLIVFNLTDIEVVYNDTFSFIASTTYPRDTFNTCYINFSLNSVFGLGQIDSFIFEGSTEHTETTILDMLYSLCEATGCDQDTPADILTAYSKDAKLELRKESLNSYVSTGIYYSRILETGLLEGSGKLNISKDLPLGTSITDIETRTSNDALTASPTWSSWEAVSDIGIIASPNRTYIQIRFTMNASNDLSRSPSVTNIQILDVDPVPWERKAFSYPITYDLSGYKEAVIHDCTNLHQIIENNGAEFITFDIPYNSEKRQYITSEKYIRLFGDYYITRQMNTVKSGGKTFLRVYAEAMFYNLQKAIPLIEKDFISATPSDIINYILSGTGWEIYECDITVQRDFSIDGSSNQLEQLRKVQDLFGGDLIFNNQKKQVSFLEQRTEDNGVIFAYKKNMEDINKEVDSSDLANRVYVYGEDGLTIADVNDGKAYLTNDISSYVPQGEIYCKEVTIGYFTDPTELKNYANYIKLDYATPKVSYELKAKDLSVLENLDLSYNIGDTITVFDEELDLQLSTRIVAIDYNILVPNESVITLSNKLKNIGDEITEFKKHQQRLDKINWLTMFRMFRFYLQDKIRGEGWIEAQYTKFGENVFVGALGTVNLPNTNEFLNIRTGQSRGYSIIGALKHGETFIVQEISWDKDWYRINL